MEHWLWILLAALFFECKGEDKVIQPGGEVIAAEGDSVTLNCTFEASDNYVYLFWYKQEMNSYPKYMLRRDSYETEDNAPEFKIEKFNAKLKDKSVPLTIQNLHVSDSAVYYCALRNAGGQYKIFFGSGTRLTVEHTTKVPPNFYYLKNPNEEEDDVCLATSFTRYYDVMKAEHPGGFNETKPTMITGSNGVYNQVAFLDKNGAKTCRALSTDEPSSPKPDPVVNLASLTIFGLRVIFFKTVVFNVLMTLRLWSSQ